MTGSDRVFGVLLATATVVALLALVIGLSASGPAVAQSGGPIEGEPRLDAVALDPSSILTPGATNEVTVQIWNDGRITGGSVAPDERGIVTTARNVRMEVEGDGPIDVKTDRQSIGTLTEDEPTEVPIRIEVAEDAEPGTYELDVRFRYRHNAQVNQGQVTHDRSRAVTRTIEVEVDDGPRFDLRNATTDAQIGDEGSMRLEIENVGATTAEDLSVALESTSPRIGFGESTTDTASLHRLEPGEVRKLEYDIAVDERASLRAYGFEGSVTYVDEDGIEGYDDRPTVNVTPLADQRFSVDPAESTLRVGEDGSLHGTVRNDGPVPVRSVVVRFADDSPTLVPIEDRIAVGSLAPGEEASFSLPIDVSRDAEPGDREIDLQVTYRNEDNEVRSDENVQASTTVAEQRDEFHVDVLDREIQAGSSVLFEVEVTNNLDERVTDVEAKLFTSDPLDSDDDEGYVEALDPGESTTIVFELHAASGAVPKTYPVSMDFRYDDDRGRSTVSDTYRVAVTVLEGEDTGLSPIILGGVVIVILIAGGSVLYSRRRG